MCDVAINESIQHALHDTPSNQTEMHRSIDLQMTGEQQLQKAYETQS